MVNERTMTRIRAACAEANLPAREGLDAIEITDVICNVAEREAILLRRVKVLWDRNLRDVAHEDLTKLLGRAPSEPERLLCAWIVHIHLGGE